MQRPRRDFEMLEMKAGETVTDYLGCVMVIANDMRNAGEDMSDVKIVEKVIRTMTESFNFVVCTIEESRDLDSMTVDELQSSLLIHEQKIRRKVNDKQVLKVENDHSTGRGRGRGRGYSNRGRGRGRGRSQSENRPQFDKSQIECYKCHELRNFQYECSNDARAVNYAEFEDNEEILLMATVDVEGYEKETERLMAAVSEDKHDKDSFWFLDSACSNHMTGIKECVGQLQEKSLTFVIQGGVCMVFHPQKGLIITSNMTKNRMFPVNVPLQLQNLNCLQVSDDSKTQLWHKRFGHVNHKAIRTMLYKRMVKGLPSVAEKHDVCDGYQENDKIKTKLDKTGHGIGKRAKKPKPKAYPFAMDQPGPT
ncbi:retrovirus-related pol polyprotein from transposon TNT 1-94 [Tanacetum coccineum]